jgi:hypothetical protein
MAPDDVWWLLMAPDDVLWLLMDPDDVSCPTIALD